MRPRDIALGALGALAACGALPALLAWGWAALDGALGGLLSALALAAVAVGPAAWLVTRR